MRMIRFLILFFALTYTNLLSAKQSDSIRIELTKEVDKFIKQKYPKSKLNAKQLIDSCIRYEFDPVFALSQGIIESSLGTKGRATKTHSLWNVGSSDGYSIAKISSKYKYKSVNDAIGPYMRLVNSKYKGNKSFNSLMKHYVTIKGKKRYASNPDYEKELSSTYKRLCKTTRIDDLWKQL